MKPLSPNVLRELISLNQQVNKNLINKGYVPPKKTKDGHIKVGSFIIKKDARGFYDILDIDGFMMVSNLNLPQSAAILANKMALGIRTDNEIVILDAYYGHYSFDEQHCKHLYEKNCDRKNYAKADLFLEKLQNARLKKKYFYNRITEGFSKLIKII
jgi:hypothetical protein